MMMMMNIFNDGTGHSTMHLFNRTAPMSFVLSPPSVYTGFLNNVPLFRGTCGFFIALVTFEILWNLRFETWSEL